MSDHDWDSIREAEGFEVGNYVKAHGPAVGIIRNILWVKTRYRAKVFWPTISRTSMGHKHPGGSEQFVDLTDLSHATPEEASQQLDLL